MFFKKEEIALEALVFSIYKYKLNIYLNNVLNHLNFLNFFNYYEKVLYLKNKSQNNNFVYLKRYNLFLCACFSVRNIELISKYIGFILLRDKRHIRNIKIFLKRFFILYYKKILGIKGFKLYISGKINGKMRKSKYSYKVGKLLLNTLDFKIKYFYFPLYTTFGALSIKV